MLRIYWNQFLLGLKLYTRIPAAIFWVIAFPMVMLLGMGTVFSSQSGQEIKLVWERSGDPSAGDSGLQTALAERGMHVEILDHDAAEERWQSGKMAALLIGGNGDYKLRLNSYSAAQGMQINALIQQGFLTAQARAAGAGELARIPVEMSSPGGHRGGPYAAYLLPGLLGLNLLMMGIFSTGMADVTMREKGGYKRLATTPMPRGIYLAAQTSVRIVIVFIAACLLMAAGSIAFGIRNQGSYADLFLLMLLGATCFISLGYVLGSLSRAVETYSGIANLFFLPLMLLSGVYFSLDSAPPWLQKASDLLPLTPLLKAMRAVFNDGASLASLGTSLALLGGWTVILFILAVRRFRWV